MGGGERRGEVEGEEVVGRRPFSEGGFGEQSGEEKLPPERGYLSVILAISEGLIEKLRVTFSSMYLMLKHFIKFHMVFVI